ncbi:MAG: MFS transporter, partial [Methanomicrobiales archaeon]|nr:MFS transporter [Methanomicrobiales archaeon]
TTAVYLGLSSGPFIGGYLTHIFGWRSIFFINVPIGLVTLALIYLFLEGEWSDAKGEPFDLGGSIQYSLTLICVMLGFTLLPDTEGWILMAAGALMLIVFIGRERRISYPLLDLRLWSGNRPFAFSNLAALINYSATFSVTFFMSLYLQYVRGFDPWTAGAILVAQPLAQAVVSPLAGRLSDRTTPGKIASAGMALTAAGLLALVFIGDQTPLPVIVAILVVIGLGLGVFSSPNTNAVMSSVEKRLYGIAAGTLSTMRLLGQMMSMGLAMMIIAVFIGHVQITSALYTQLITSMHTAFAIFAVLCIAGIYLSLGRYRAREP